MTKEEIKEFVQKWMNGMEEDTFIKNQYGNVIYSAGASSLNLTMFFEDLLTDFLESENERLKAEREWISIKDGELPDNGRDILLGDIESGIVSIGFFSFQAEGFIPSSVMTITHWKELPQPPKQ